ncbi:hypothetical protein QFC24_006418 [Naganishia onofrii]|uniref:Uncharacterized protein n=1 Tax=Naganishia onofrii TaxID=1851511 RepID=A0ACC2X2Z4_9TREE|nr:hypothetical protein QFC24_006418 [Naganishia onofrii]
MHFSNIASLTVVLASLASAAPTRRCEGDGTCPEVQTWDNCLMPNQVALTFDDGPAGFEKDILQTLGDRKATFFLNGCNSQCIYDEENVKQIRALHAAGMTLGSHGWTHAHFNELTYDQMHDQLWKMEEAFKKILGLKPLYFRAPYGEMCDTLMRVLTERGYKKNFLWSDDVGDSSLLGVEYGKNVYKNISESKPQHPHMILNHASHESTVKEILPYAIEELECAEYEIVAVDTCLGCQGEWPYEWVGEPQERDETWVC